MAFPLILYDTLLRLASATLTDPGTESGFSLADIHDYRSFTVWKSDDVTSPINIDIDLGGSTATADYIMLVNHNLNTVAASVEVFADTFTPPTTSKGSFSPAEDTVSLKEFTQTAALRYWRVQIVNGGGFSVAPFIGELFLGNKLSLPRYLAPTFDPFFKQVEVEGSRSRGGHYLGASFRGQTHRGEITFGRAGATRAEFTSDLNALVEHALLRRPFGFVLDTADTDFDDCRYLKLADEAEVQRLAVGGSWQNLTFSLPVEEAFSEPAT